MNKSQIFKKAHQIAKNTVSIVGDYLVAFSLALKEVYASLKKEISIEEKLINAGCSVWENYGKKRIYINTNKLNAVFGLSLSFYGTGNISCASLNGEHISNSRARKLIENKIFFDCLTGEFVGTEMECVL